MLLFSFTIGCFLALLFLNLLYFIALGSHRLSVANYQKRHGMPWERMFSDPTWQAPIGLRWFSAYRNMIVYEYKRWNLIAVFISAALTVVNGIMTWSTTVALQGLGMTMVIALTIALLVKLK